MIPSVLTVLIRYTKITLISLLVFLIGAFITQLRNDQLHQQDAEALNVHFNTYSSKAYLSLQQGIQLEYERLNSLATVFRVNTNVSRTDFDKFAAVIMSSEHSIQSLQWIPLVKDAERKSFEQRVRAEGFKDFTIFSIDQGRLVEAKKSDEYAVVNYIYPFKGNESALGIDTYSSQGQKADLIKLYKNHQHGATPPIHLVQTPGKLPAVILYQPVYTAENKLKGFVSLILRVDDFLSHIKKIDLLERSIQYLIYDINAVDSPYTLGDINRDDSANEFMRSHHFFMPMGTRDWNFVTQVDLRDLPEYVILGEGGHRQQVVFGLLISLLLSVLLFVWLKSLEDKKRTKKKIKLQKLRYEDLFEQSSDAFYVLDCSGNILNVNSEAINRLGYSKEALLKMNFAEIDHKYTVNSIKELCTGIEANHKILFESKHQRQDGTVFPVEISARKCVMSNQCVVSLFARDLTERLTFRELSLDNTQLHRALDKYTHELAEQKNAFETVFQKSADGIFITEGRHVLDCNEATVKMFGYTSKDEILRLPNRVFAPKYQPDGRSSHRSGYEKLQTCLKEGSHRYEWVNRRSNGEEFWTDVVLTRIEYYGRQVVHIAFRDISKRKQFQAEANTAREAALKASKEKSDFLANMTHEIRTPLHGILSYAQMGETRVGSVSNEKLERYFSSIHISAQRLLLLLNDVLETAKLDSGLMRFDLEYQDVKQAVDTSLVEQAGLAAEKNIQLMSSGLAQNAYFDLPRLAQVLSNILSNAIRFSPENSTILVKIESLSEERICVSVSDEGPGILDEDLSTIFDQFIQGRDNLENRGGTGLGLAICREIIKAHRSEIWVENRYSSGKVIGAVFKFTLAANKQVWLDHETE